MSAIRSLSQQSGVYVSSKECMLPSYKRLSVITRYCISMQCIPGRDMVEA